MPIFLFFPSGYSFFLLFIPLFPLCLFPYCFPLYPLLLCSRVFLPWNQIPPACSFPSCSATTGVLSPTSFSSIYGRHHILWPLNFQRQIAVSHHIPVASLSHLLISIFLRPQFLHFVHLCYYEHRPWNMQKWTTCFWACILLKDHARWDIAGMFERTVWKMLYWDRYYAETCFFICVLRKLLWVIWNDHAYLQALCKQSCCHESSNGSLAFV